MSDTPRTDALIMTHAGTASLGDMAVYYNSLLDHARQIERELAEERTAKELWKEEWRQAVADKNVAPPEGGTRGFKAVGYVDLAGVAHWEPGRLPEGVEAMLYISQLKEINQSCEGWE